MTSRAKLLDRAVEQRRAAYDLRAALQAMLDAEGDIDSHREKVKAQARAALERAEAAGLVPL